MSAGTSVVLDGGGLRLKHVRVPLSRFYWLVFSLRQTPPSEKGRSGEPRPTYRGCAPTLGQFKVAGSDEHEIWTEFKSNNGFLGGRRVRVVE